MFFPFAYLLVLAGLLPCVLGVSRALPRIRGEEAAYKEGLGGREYSYGSRARREIPYLGGRSRARFEKYFICFQTVVGIHRRN